MNLTVAKQGAGCDFDDPLGQCTIMAEPRVLPPYIDPAETFNFQTANVLLLEQGAQGLDVLIQVFAGFGTRNCYKSMSVPEAIAITHRATLDLVIVDPMLRGQSGYEYVRWLRRSGLDPNRSVPVIMMSANGAKSAVLRARDEGANFYLLKPLRANLLFERIVRIAREPRQFIVAPNYAGPDRRHKQAPNAPRRRSSDTHDFAANDLLPELGADQPAKSAP